jgi:hypothetical protein
MVGTTFGEVYDVHGIAWSSDGVATLVEPLDDGRSVALSDIALDGAVTGTHVDASGTRQGLRYDLATGTYVLHPDSASDVLAISDDARWVTGYRSLDPGPLDVTGFIRAEPELSTTVPPLDGDTQSFCTDINVHGVAVCSSALDDDLWRAFVWTEAEGATTLEAFEPDGSSRPHAISDRFAAGSSTEGGVTSPARWRLDGSIERLSMPDDAEWGAGYDVTPDGTVIGPSGSGPLMWFPGGSWTNLSDTLPPELADITLLSVRADRSVAGVTVLGTYAAIGRPGGYQVRDIPTLPGNNGTLLAEGFPAVGGTVTVTVTLPMDGPAELVLMALDEPRTLGGGILYGDPSRALLRRPLVITDGTAEIEVTLPASPRMIAREAIFQAWQRVGPEVTMTDGLEVTFGAD